MQEVEAMNDSSPDFDPTIAARFRSEHTQLPPEPFVRTTLRRVAAERVRARIVKYALQAAVLVAVACASPWLIKTSTLLSNELDGLFAKASTLLGTPIGMIAAALGATISAALLRARTHR
jgi:hypothetical protein